MTQSVKTLLDTLQVRKSKKQKAAFTRLIQDLAQREGYACQVEKGAFGVKNIVVGDVSSAKVVYGAHYDTCAVLPFPNFIAPKAFWLYLLYQLAIILGFLIFAFLLGSAIGFVGALLNVEAQWASAAGALVYWAILGLMLFGPANKHTVNDNSSGVAVLMEMMEAMPEESRREVAFVFFDMEEAGLFGSSAFASAHKKEMKDKLLVNFDCVSDGEDILFILKKKARPYRELFEAAFPTDETVKTEVLCKGVFYPSDQANFPLGVGAAAFLKSKRFSFLYLDKIHTPKDLVYREENIRFLTQGGIRLLQKL